MSETDDIIEVGTPLPRIAHVEPANGPFCLSIRWAEGQLHGEEVIDLAPQIFTFKVYAPLREDPALFAKASVSEDGTAITWPGNADLEISSDAIEELADATMTSERLLSFFERWV